jgi:hypothetical protein
MYSSVPPYSFVAVFASYYAHVTRGVWSLSGLLALGKPHLWVPLSLSLPSLSLDSLSREGDCTERVGNAPACLLRTSDVTSTLYGPIQYGARLLCMYQSRKLATQSCLREIPLFPKARSKPSFRVSFLHEFRTNLDVCTSSIQSIAKLIVGSF